ncbi:MAG TPA: hypothetical protein VK953_01685 [Methylophilus sp.]|nr:hypothetical protein [Methylophilus sp.]
MKLILSHQLFFRRIKLNLAFQKAYRGSFMMIPSSKGEKGLTALLCGGMGLMVMVACMQMKAMFVDTENHAAEALSKNIQPPPMLTSKLSAKQGLSEISIEGKNTDTLFQLDKQELLNVPSPEQHTQTEKPYRAAKLTLRHSQLWQLQIHRPFVPQALMVNAIANAHQRLQSGHVDLARQVFLNVLNHDMHSVGAIEGMLLVSRQLGDKQSEGEYLERLRQEIPDYNDGNVTGKDASSAGDQG